MSFDQVGVIPYRHDADGVHVLLITSRKRGRWICPKGNVESDLGPRDSAHLEAFEEAGVEGRLLRPPIGTYEHNGDARVRIFLLAVEREYEAWPEDDERERRWLPLEKARTTVDEDGLRRLLNEAERRLRQPINGITAA